MLEMALCCKGGPWAIPLEASPISEHSFQPPMDRSTTEIGSVLGQAALARMRSALGSERGERHALRRPPAGIHHSAGGAPVLTVAQQQSARLQCSRMGDSFDYAVSSQEEQETEKEEEMEEEQQEKNEKKDKEEDD